MGLPAQAILAEFEKAQSEIRAYQKNAAVWQFILNKYNPTLLSSCNHAVKMSKKLMNDSLMQNMCAGNQATVDAIMNHFSSHDDTQTHSRHIMMEKCKSLGVKVIELEDPSL